MLRPGYSGKTRSIPWLLLPGFLRRLVIINHGFGCITYTGHGLRRGTISTTKAITVSRNDRKFAYICMCTKQILKRTGLTDCDLLTQYGVTDLGPDRFQSGLLLPAPSHYLDPCWRIVRWNQRNKLQWNSNQLQRLWVTTIHTFCATSIYDIMMDFRLHD